MEQLEWFQSFLVPGGIPSHDTFGEVFGLDPQFQSCFMAWAIAELLPGEVVANKTARRSYDRAGGKGAMHPVS